MFNATQAQAQSRSTAIPVPMRSSVVEGPAGIHLG